MATMNVMAPLLVGTPENLQSAESQVSWREFARQLTRIKNLGVQGVSTDIWWGLVEPAPGKFTWSYYDRLVEAVLQSGLKWVPVLSTHRCGGNLGDYAYVPIPHWVWGKLASRLSTADLRAGMWLSEDGNWDDECVSVWASSHIMEDYARLLSAFQEHFRGVANQISEVTLSLGPSGELRYPSYGGHDFPTPTRGYPSRGRLQCYSPAAQESFRQFMLGRYGSLDAINRELNTHLQSLEEIRPPTNQKEFFKKGHPVNLRYGRDLFDWYQGSLLSHGLAVMETAMKTFAAPAAPFRGIDVGAKIPGVHWRVGRYENGRLALADRYAELTAGLISTGSAVSEWQSDEGGRGYRSIISLFRTAQNIEPASRVVLHFTCLEMADGQGQPAALSLPHTLSRWVAQEAARQQVTLKGENAMAENLDDSKAWQLLQEALSSEGYQGLTLLRMDNILRSEFAQEELRKLSKAAHVSDLAA